MSASSSATSSTISRSRGTILVLTTVAAACCTYYLYTVSTRDAESTSSTGAGRLHRSRSVHGRRRRDPATRDAGTSIFVDESTENDDPAPLTARTLTDVETVIDDHAYLQDFDTGPPESSIQRNGQNIVQLLFRVSEDATRRNSYCHRGCACNGCGVVPIRGIRYRCANCIDYDLCEGCEAQGVHDKAHIFYKIRVPAPAYGPRHIQPVWYTGDPQSTQRPLPRAVIPRLTRETGFERPELDAYWEQWTFMANTDWRDDPDDINLAMDRKTFERCLAPASGYRQAAPNLIFDRMFAFYDTNKDDLISFPEFLHGIAYRKTKDKWLKVFQGYDIDGDGFIDRKDCLRLFRSYYVLYRQMNRDIMESTEEEQVSKMETLRLVSGRQPLSSFFGTQGGYPRAPDTRSGEGKALQPNGELEITDGKRVINENSTDTGEREAVFQTDLLRHTRDLWTKELRRSGYGDVLINPPQTVEELSEVALNFTRSRVEMEDIYERSALQGAVDGAGDYPIDGGVLPRAKPDSAPWIPSFVNVTDEDVQAIQGRGDTVTEVHAENRRAVVAHAIRREQTQREVHERWKRRQFYTDEEEGATPPPDWKEQEDVLAHNVNGGESSKTPARPSIHSRSSSKVRFAEDMDDFDTRSNPSTSSRSVPERWGGMEIPDAERDAGKEILYQVTQQAFNELLDCLFKKKEDIAVHAASTKAERAQYQNLLADEEFQTWAHQKYQQKEESAFIEPEERVHLPRSFPHEQQLRAIRPAEPAPEDLIAPQPARVARGPTLAERRQYFERIANDVGLNESEQEAWPTPLHETDNDVNRAGERLAALRREREADATEQESNAQSQHLENPHVGAEASRSPEISYRDPTLPQFRPDTIPSPPRHVHLDEIPSEIPVEIPSLSDLSIPHSPDDIFPQDPASPIFRPKTPANTEDTPDMGRLYFLWRCERAEKEKEARGGWGRLSFEEFEKLVKAATRDGKGSKWDYLGSWIEFCIP